MRRWRTSAAGRARCATSTARAVVTDGPYAEGVEQLGGFYLIEADSQDVLLDLCRLLPSSYAVEVRPVIRDRGL